MVLKWFYKNRKYMLGIFYVLWFSNQHYSPQTSLRLSTQSKIIQKIYSLEFRLKYDHNYFKSRLFHNFQEKEGVDDSHLKKWVTG